MNHKKCATCKKIKSDTTEHFKILKGELTSTCLICLAAKKQWAKANKNKTREISLRYKETHKENIAEYQKQYRNGPARAKRLLDKKKWRENNKERYRKALRYAHVKRMKKILYIS